MLQSLYSGVSGLKNFQTELNVIGNNIANVGTTGFKENRVSFQDMFSQTLQNAIQPNGTPASGGQNPEQVGTGSQIASTDTIDTQGGTQTTGRTLDLAIQGDGYFAIQSSIDPTKTYYTRAGNFYLNPNADGSSTLVTATGDKVLDSTGAAITIPAGATGLNINSSGNITYTDSTGATQSIATLGLTMFSNPEGLEKTGNNLYAATNNSGAPNASNGGYYTPGQNGAGSLQSGALEMSNVDLTDQMTQMIVAQQAFDANSKTVTTSDQILQEIINMKQ